MSTSSATGPARPRSRLKRFLTDRNGATAVEFGLVAAPFIALLVGIVQTFAILFASQLLETVVTQSSRLILTGQAQAANTTQSGFSSLVCQQVTTVFDCTKLMIDVQTVGSFSTTSTGAPILTFNAQGQVTNTWQYNPGGPGQIVVVRVMYLWPVFLGPLGFTLSNEPGGNRLIMASAAFQNEPL